MRESRRPRSWWVSHDQRLLETTCDRLWVVVGGSAVAVRWRLPHLAGGDGRRLDGGERDRDRERLRTGDRPVAGSVVAGTTGRRNAAARRSATNGRLRSRWRVTVALVEARPVAPAGAVSRAR